MASLAVFETSPSTAQEELVSEDMSEDFAEHIYNVYIDEEDAPPPQIADDDDDDYERALQRERAAKTVMCLRCHQKDVAS